jgi:hypothetical protein
MEEMERWETGERREAGHMVIDKTQGIQWDSAGTVSIHQIHILLQL